jgi:hypothetical protein
MEQHISVAMPQRVAIVRQIDAAETQRAAGRGAMRILAKSNA